MVAFFTAEDLPGHNLFGPIFRDEPFLVDGAIQYYDQTHRRRCSRLARIGQNCGKAIRIECLESTPILTIDQAIAENSWLGPRRLIERGDVEQAFRQGPLTIEGIFESNGQEQLYFESQACIAYPGENHSIRVVSSTQNPTENR